MSGRITAGFVDFLVCSLEIDCVAFRRGRLRNWCGPPMPALLMSGLSTTRTVPWVRIPLSPPFARFCAPTYDFGLFVRDSALLGLDACAGCNNAGCPHNCGSGPECNRAISTAGYSWFQASSRKSRRKAQRRFWCGADSELRGAACGAKQPFVGIDKGRCIAQRFVFNRAKCARQLRSSMPGAEARLAPQERPSSLRHLMPFRKTKILDLYFVALSSN
jgi:hypothetical protein